MKDARQCHQKNLCVLSQPCFGGGSQGQGDRSPSGDHQVVSRPVNDSLLTPPSGVLGCPGMHSRAPQTPGTQGAAAAVSRECTILTHTHCIAIPTASAHVGTSGVIFVVGEGQEINKTPELFHRTLSCIRQP